MGISEVHGVLAGLTLAANIVAVVICIWSRVLARRALDRMGRLQRGTNLRERRMGDD